MKKTKASKTSSTSHLSLPTPIAEVDDSCKSQITPACLQAIYNMPSTPASSNRTNLFVATFAQESATQSDLQVSSGDYKWVNFDTTHRIYGQAFLGKFRKGSQPARVILGSLDGGITGFASSGTTEAVSVHHGSRRESHSFPYRAWIFNILQASRRMCPPRSYRWAQTTPTGSPAFWTSSTRFWPKMSCRRCSQRVSASTKRTFQPRSGGKRALILFFVD